MKTATLFFTAILLLLSAPGQSCPISPSEIVCFNIYNQHGRLYTAKVEVRMKTDIWKRTLRPVTSGKYDRQKKVYNYIIDSSRFEFNIYRHMKVISLPEYEFVISAPGYADVVIDGLNASYSKDTSKKDEFVFFANLVKIDVVMYTKQGMKVNNEYVVFDRLQVKNLSFKDSTRLDWTFYKKEAAGQEWNYTSGVQEETRVSARAYPNPVKDNLHIQLSYFPLAAHRIELHDANGKLVDKKEFQMEGYDLVMGWYAPGTYFLTIYDPSNTAILRQQIVHQ